MIELIIHTGDYCHRNETVIVYQREPRRRIMMITAEPNYDAGYFLSKPAIGKSDPANGRIFASTWMYSNCTGSWNGAFLRIELSHARRFENVLNRSMVARNDIGLSASVKDDDATFSYSAGIIDTIIMTRPGISK